MAGSAPSRQTRLRSAAAGERSVYCTRRAGTRGRREGQLRIRPRTLAVTVAAAATMLVVAPFVMFVFIALELFVGVIQALIFSMLSLVFLSIATAHEDAHGAHTPDDGATAEFTHGEPV